MKQKYTTLITIFAIVALFVAAGFMPLLLPQYNLNMLTEIIIFALFAVSYNLLLGYAGLLSFGHAMFFGIGAYMTAIAIIHIPGLSMWNAVLIAIGATIIVGAVIGSLLLRTKGAYFALLTLAFNALFYAIVTKWSSVTGGDDGLGIRFHGNYYEFFLSDPDSHRRGDPLLLVFH
jgi:branched-chain amino acid transport system permease protein